MAYPTVRVEVAFTTAPTSTVYWHIGDSVRGKIGTAAVGPESFWVDISHHVQKVTIVRGANRVEGPVVRSEAGKATIELNNSSRDYDPTNLSGPYVAAGVTQVTPMRAVRIRATWNGVDYDLFRGSADSWRVRYDSGPSYSSVTLTATDGMKTLAAYNRPDSAPVGAGEDTGARIARILDSANWPLTDRIVAVGDSTLQETNLGGNALTEAQEAAEAEAGEFYVDEAGRAVFRNRLAVLEESRSADSQGTFGDLEDGSELLYADVEIEYDDATIYNLVRVTREGGVEQVAADVVSQSDYLVHTFERSGWPLQTDADALAYAQWVLYQGKDPELRFSTLTLKPRRDEDNLFPQALGRQFGDRITIMRRPPGGGDPIQRDVFIRGVTHEIGGLDWRTTWVLSSATRFSFFRIGHATLGRVGLNAIAY